MAGGGFIFLLVTFQYLVGWGIFNLIISIDYKSRNTLRVLQLWGSACFQQLENYHLPAVVPTARRQGAAVRFRLTTSVGIAIASRYVISGRTYLSAMHYH